MDHDQILARLHLHAVLPVLAKVVGFDDEAKAIVKDWNATFQFSFLGGPSVQLKFDNGGCRAYRQPATNADVSFWFPTAGLLNAMFTGKGFTLPLINGFWNVKLLKGFTALAKRMEFYLKECDGKELSDDLAKKVLDAKLSVATWGTAVLAECDPHMATYANNMPAGGAVNVIIKPEGPDYFFKKTASGSFLAGDGQMKDPAAMLTFASWETAMKLVTGKLDVMAALGKRDVVIRGLLPMVDDMSAIMAKIDSYLA